MNETPSPENPASPSPALEPPSRSRMGTRLVAPFIGLLAIDGCFWITADFRRFMPPDDGPFYERMMLTICGALGPMFLVWRGCAADSLAAFVFALVLIGAVAAAIIGRGHLFWRALGYVGVLLWFGFGCMMTSLRIT